MSRGSVRCWRDGILTDINIEFSPTVFHSRPTSHPIDKFWKDKFKERTDIYLLGEAYHDTDPRRVVHYLGSLMMASVKHNNKFLDWLTSNVFHEVGHILMEDEDLSPEEEDHALFTIQNYIWPFDDGW